MNVKKQKPLLLPRLVLVLFFIILIISSSYFLKSVGATSNHIVVKGNTLPVVARGRAHFRGHYSKPNQLTAQQIHFLVGLALRNETEVDARVRSLYNPESPYFNSFLTPEQFTALYSPSLDEYNAVQSWLSSSGFHIDATYPNRLIIGASGTIQQIENAFGVQINEYNYSGQVFFANAVDPQVPAQFDGVIGSIVGLDNFQTFRPHIVRNASMTSDPTYTPQQILAAYKIQPLIDAGYRGVGQSIAIATAYNYTTSDVRTFQSTYGLAQNPLVNIPIGASSVPYDALGSRETTLDVEWSSAVAQGATIRVYMAVDAYETTFTTMYNRIVTDNIASVISTSWGLDEPSMPSAIISQQHVIFQQAAAQGISIFAASGDNGVYDSSGDFGIGVNYPASDPYVTGVGGTSLYLTPSDQYSSETAWHNSYGASGGGVSNFFTKPSWQSGITAFSSSGTRGVPDVAYDADPTTGQSFYYSGAWYSGGGTSIGAPEWAGITAIWIQYRGSAGRLGSANPILYNLASANQAQYFHDVVSGSNGYYSTWTGWDLATGWGSPNAYNLVTNSTTTLLPLSVSLVSPPSPSNGGIINSSPVALEVQVTSGGAVQGATVTIYVDGSSLTSGSSDSNGYYSISYSLTQVGHTYSWYATASKSGYNSATSSTATFTYPAQSTTSSSTTTSIITSQTTTTPTTTTSTPMTAVATTTTTMTTTTTLLFPSTIITTIVVTTYTLPNSGTTSATSTNTATVSSISTNSYSIPPMPKCLIATAAFGSELTPQVQALRNFRDELVLKTFAGSQFMRAFNAWYYSFSPSVARIVSNAPPVAAFVRIFIYPLVGILQVASAAYIMFDFNSELGVTIAGLLASSLIGLVYDTPWMTTVLIVAKKKRRFEMKLRYLIPFAGAWVASLIMIGIADLFMAPLLMILATVAFVLLTLGLSATVTATLILKKLA